MTSVPPFAAEDRRQQAQAFRARRILGDARSFAEIVVGEPVHPSGLLAVSPRASSLSLSNRCAVDRSAVSVSGSPGRARQRGETRAMIEWPPSVALRWTSAPIGSASSTSILSGAVKAGSTSAGSSSWKLSGRSPRTHSGRRTGRGLAWSAAAAAAALAPSNSATKRAVRLAHGHVDRKFICGAPMKPATNMLTGWS